MEGGPKISIGRSDSVRHKTKKQDKTKILSRAWGNRTAGPNQLRLAVLGSLLSITFTSGSYVPLLLLEVHGERFNICSFEERKKPRFIVYAYCHGVNTSTVVNFKLVMTSVNAELGIKGNNWLLPAGMSWLPETIILKIIMTTCSGWVLRQALYIWYFKS